MKRIPGYLSVDEYAQAEGLHRETVKRRLREGRLDGIKVEGACWLIPENGQTGRGLPRLCKPADRPVTGRL